MGWAGTGLERLAAPGWDARPSRRPPPARPHPTWRPSPHRRRRGRRRCRWTAPGDVRRAGRRRLAQGTLQRTADPPGPQATLRHEGGGRLDRLDLWLVVMLVIGTLVLRTFRLEQPQQMHFDEVYHARTATEFLQAWRYGLSHDIYEWTHPHLAKYLMAAGIVLWGEDHVSATSDLEVPSGRPPSSRAGSTSPASSRTASRRARPASDSTSRPGPRSGLRPHDPPADLDRPGAGAGALAIDDTNQLVIGYDDGRLATLDLASSARPALDRLEPAARNGRPSAPTCRRQRRRPGDRRLGRPG